LEHGKSTNHRDPLIFPETIFHETIFHAMISRAMIFHATISSAQAEARRDAAWQRRHDTPVAYFDNAYSTLGSFFAFVVSRKLDMITTALESIPSFRHTSRSQGILGPSPAEPV
jgi:hypothetical protein